MISQFPTVSVYAVKNGVGAGVGLGVAVGLCDAGEPDGLDAATVLELPEPFSSFPLVAIMKIIAIMASIATITAAFFPFDCFDAVEALFAPA